MGKVKPKYIIGHWTAGNYIPNSIDMNSYDLLVTGDGILIKGLKEFDSEKCSTAGMNSITYNIACCGGLQQTPLKKVQCEKFFKTVADRLKLFGLTPNDFYTHHEIGEMTRNYLNKKNADKITVLLPYNKYLIKNIGKIDLTKMPYDNMTPTDIRNKIRWYFNK